MARKNLQPNPAYSDLQAVAARNGVILIPVGYQNHELARTDEAHPGQTHSKLAITPAILQPFQPGSQFNEMRR